jgi:hypothetical protein
MPMVHFTIHPAKPSFAPKCVPKLSLGTRGKGAVRTLYFPGQTRKYEDVLVNC